MTIAAGSNKVASNKETYRRDLNLNIVASFHPGSKVHGRRLEMLKEAVEKALTQAMAEQLPTATADVTSTMEWRYVFKEDESEFAMGAPEPQPEAEPETVSEIAAEADE